MAIDRRCCIEHGQKNSIWCPTRRPMSKIDAVFFELVLSYVIIAYLIFQSEVLIN